MVYPNLAEQLIVTDVNQLWVADITYIRLVREFVYLAVALDAFSRRAVADPQSQSRFLWRNERIKAEALTKRTACFDGIQTVGVWLVAARREVFAALFLVFLSLGLTLTLFARLVG